MFSAGRRQAESRTPPFAQPRRGAIGRTCGYEHSPGPAGGCGTGEDQTTSLIMRDCALPDHTMGAASCFFALLFPLKYPGQSPSGGRSDGPRRPKGALSHALVASWRPAKTKEPSCLPCSWQS